MQTSLLILIVLYSILLGCSNSIDPNYNSKIDTLTNLDAKQAIALGNEWRDSSPQIKTFITSKEVIIEFPDGREVKKTLPDSLMYIGIAPFINNTHVCSTHYPSSCSGELAEKNLNLIAKDDNGTIYIDGNITTLKHGFFELWLPRNRTIKLFITYNSMTGEETISTNSSSRTCITTIKLK